MNEGLFDSDLSYQDAVENFFAWKKQTLIGSETINGVNCQILESKPDSSSVSVYAKVRSWIDPQRFVPLRIEKYSSSGGLVRRIDVTRVARDEKHNPIPASLTVHGPRKNSVTEFNGARIDQDVQFTDADFTAAGFEIARGYLLTALSTSPPALSRSASASRGPINCRLVKETFAPDRGTGTASAGLPAKLTATVFCN